MSYSKNPRPRKAETNLATADAELVAKITKAVAAANEAEQTVTTAQAELVSRSKTVGLLLLEAKKLHPKVKDFETFLNKVQGLKLSRAYDLLRLAGGRTTDEELKKDARERKQKSRNRRKSLPKPDFETVLKKAQGLPEPEPKPVSVTDPPVTESPEVSAEQRKALNADFDLTPEEKAAKVSAHNLAEFTYACKTYLPKLNEADLETAHAFVNEWCTKETKKGDAEPLAAGTALTVVTSPVIDPETGRMSAPELLEPKKGKKKIKAKAEAA